MGWSGYHVPEPIDRKRECDLSNTWDDDISSCKVLKSSLKGRVYYAACEYTNKKTGKIEVFGQVCLTRIDSKDYCNFYIKKMSEDMGPVYYDCPIGIIKLLDPTDNEYANEWRATCLKRAKHQNKRNRVLNKLPVGSIIEFKMGEETIQVSKHEPNGQFNTTWWKVINKRSYVRKKNIPDDFTIISTGLMH